MARFNLQLKLKGRMMWAMYSTGFFAMLAISMGIHISYQMYLAEMADEYLNREAHLYALKMEQNFRDHNMFLYDYEGLDTLDSYNLFHNLEFFQGADAWVVDADNTVIFSTDTLAMGQTFAENLSYGDELRLNRSAGLDRRFEIKVDNATHIYCFVPIKMQGQADWMFIEHIEQSSMMNLLIQIGTKTWWLFVILMIWMYISYSVKFNYIIKPLTYIRAVGQKIAAGRISSVTRLQPPSSRDELYDVVQSFNKVWENLMGMRDFLLKTGEVEMTPEMKKRMSDGDELMEAMYNMKKALLATSSKEEEYREEENRRNWKTQGLAMFNMILRKENGTDTEELYYQLISKLVEYIGCNQGGLFIVEGDEQNEAEGDKRKNVYLELKACYAYERRKYEDAQIAPGIGLVGTCYLERQTIYMTDIPQSYVRITSGIGEATPRVLVLIPMIENEREVVGVLELASFNPIEPYKIEFLEQVGAVIALAIAGIKHTQHMSRLVEQSKQQMVALREQEETMHQNLEEMAATQEDMRRRQEEAEEAHARLDTTLKAMQTMQRTLEEETNTLHTLMDGVDRVFLRFVFDSAGKLVEVCQQVLDMYQVDADALKGSNPQEVLPVVPENFKHIWSEVLSGNPHEYRGTRSFKGEEQLFGFLLIPLMDSLGTVEKILVLGRNLGGLGLEARKE